MSKGYFKRKNVNWNYISIILAILSLALSITTLVINYTHV